MFVMSVSLGSIPELPAESCEEIKASEGGQAISGKYWLDSIIPGKVLAHCDMETEGKTTNLIQFLFQCVYEFFRSNMKLWKRMFWLLFLLMF